MWGLPTLASSHGQEIDTIILLIHVVMLAAFVGWGIFFAVPLFRYRAGKHREADHRGLRTRAPLVAVGLLTLVELVLLVGWSLPFWDTQVNALPDDEDAVVVRVVAQQFQWNVHYPGPDGVFGRSDPALVDAQSNLLGLDRDDPNGEDDITTLNQLHLPVGVEVIIYLSSKDVIHSFSLPEFRVKQDVIPGMRIPIHFKPTLTTVKFREQVGDPARNFEIACAQLCGLNHFTMKGFVTVETEDEFQAWLQKRLDEKREAAEDDWLF